MGPVGDYNATGSLGDSDDNTLLGRLGRVDNLDEPIGAFNRRSTILGLLITFMLLSWFCVILRLYTRFRIIRSPWWDDLFVVLSLTMMSIGKIAILMSTNTGMGKHMVLLSKNQIASYQHVFYVANGSYSTSTALIKISLLLQYLRLYRPGSYQYTICRGLIVFVALWGTAYSFLAWVPCVPVHSFWDQIHNPGGLVHCYAYGSPLVSVMKATYESHAGLNFALDLLVMGLPIPLYFQKDTPLRTKMGLVGILVMGGFVNLFALWRFITMVQHESATAPTFDPTWYGPVTIVMASLETSAACICASIPVFWQSILDSAAGLIGQIFVTKEIKVTSQNRFEVFGDRHDFHDLELQGATLSRETSKQLPAAETYIAQTWMGWASEERRSDDGAQRNITVDLKTWDGWKQGED